MLDRCLRSGVALFALGLLLHSAIAAETKGPVQFDNHQGVVRVACVGDSITAGVGAEGGKSYPAQLGKMLGDKWEVRNFGVSGSTLLNHGDLPYQKQQAFQDAL